MDMITHENSKDMNFSEALQTIFDPSEQTIYELTVEQQSSIKTSKNQIKKGKFHKNQDVISEMKEWLKKK